MVDDRHERRKEAAKTETLQWLQCQRRAIPEKREGEKPDKPVTASQAEERRKARLLKLRGEGGKPVA